MRQIALLIAFLLVFGSPAALLAASAPPAEPGGDYPVPPEAAPGGSTPERTSTWNGLPPTEQQQHVDTFFNQIVPQAIATFGSARQEEAERETTSGEHPLLGRAVSRPAGAPAAFGAPALIGPKDASAAPAAPPPSSFTDLDADGLDDAFEDGLAFAFRPFYHVSAGERAGTGFADFGNFLPQTAVQVYGSVPARNHVRVKPLGFTWINGQHSGVIQVDYMTMWNRDDGLVISSWCSFLGFGLFNLLEPIVANPHDLDNERSAVLVAAPSVGGTYNPSPGAYKAYDYYTAAHEDTFNDKSLYFAPSSPIPAYTSVRLGTSLSKHATYPFNPSGLPLVPSWIIYSTYDFLFYLYWTGQIPWWQYLAYLYLADVSFYVCAIEHFIEQGGTFPGASRNIGDVGHAINASGFIHHPPLRDKLNKVLWYLN